MTLWDGSFLKGPSRTTCTVLKEWGRESSRGLFTRRDGAGGGIATIRMLMLLAMRKMSKGERGQRRWVRGSGQKVSANPPLFETPFTQTTLLRKVKEEVILFCVLGLHSCLGLPALAKTVLERFFTTVPGLSTRGKRKMQKQEENAPDVCNCPIFFPCPLVNCWIRSLPCAV